MAGLVGHVQWCDGAAGRLCLGGWLWHRVENGLKVGKTSRTKKGRGENSKNNILISMYLLW